MSDIVYQPRCVFCLCEHYAMSVRAISTGEVACGTCGRTPPVFATVADYHAALQRRKQES